MPHPASTWLTLRAGLRDLLLEEHHRPYTIFKSFLSLDNQTPQMITFIGERTKSLVMQKLRFGARPYESISGQVHLRVDEETAKQGSPLLLADCELHNLSFLTKAETEGYMGDIVQRPLTWHKRLSQGLDPASLAHLIYAKLIAPFSNVICFFAEDLGGMQAVAGVLAVWLMSFSNRPSDLPFSTRPRVLILTRCSDPTTFDEQSATKRFMMDLGRESERKNGMIAGQDNGKLKKAQLDEILSQQFGGMRVVGYPDLDPGDSGARAWRSLRTRILKDSNELQDRRRDSLVAFSARHFKAFFHLACDHFCTDIVSPFGFIRASRLQNPVPQDLSLHMARFIKQVKPSQLLNFAVPMIASALMFDSYVSEMHAFHPLLVFRQFFYQLCLSLDPFRTKDRIVGGFTSPQLVNAIEVSFCQLAFKVTKDGADEVLVHQKVMGRFKDLWKDTYDYVSCFSCMARGCEHTLECHHSLCSACTISHGTSTEDEPWNFLVKICPFCEKPNRIPFSQKPHTAGVRSLIVEGGGVRGVVPLTFLSELEKAIGLPMDIQDHIDIAFGSSSGALVVLGLCVNRWSVEECMGKFVELSRLAFEKRRCFGLPLTSNGMFRRFLEVILSFVTDSRYSSTGITSALKSAFGENRPFFESSAAGTKVAVVATTTQDSSTCIFTNYNGPGSRSSESGYRIIRPESSEKEMSIWQAARASSAAPPYFKSFRGYQDGGLGGHNNPINLALWEQDIIWSRDKKQPDFVLSLGTGFKRSPDIDSENPAKSSFFRDRCVPRLFRSFLNFFVGESRWQEVQNSLPPQVRDRYHRFNIEFYGAEPELDNLEAIPNLRRQATAQALSFDEIKKCAENMLVSLFYLELDEYPQFDKIVFVCSGKIRCRLGPSHRGLRALASRLRETQARFYLDFQQTLPCIDEASYEAIENGHPFSRPVVLRVKSLESAIDIKMDGITSRARSISNCPYQVKTLIKDERLDCVFGHRSGKKRRRAPIEQPSKRVRLVY